MFLGKALMIQMTENGLNMEDFFKVDEEAFKNAFKVDTSKMNIDSSVFSDMDFSDVDLSDLVDGDALADAMPSFSEKGFSGYSERCIGESDAEFVGRIV